MPTIIGLTGGIGSGKTTVSNSFSKLGARIVDADVIAREVVQPNTTVLEQIRDKLGSHLITDQGELDRRAMRELVFNDPEKRRALESITHPAIGQRIVQQLRFTDTNAPYTLLSSPLLFETKQHELVSQVIVVDLPEAIQLKRATLRDTQNISDIQRIMNVQLKRETRLLKADFIVDNSGSLANTLAQVEKLHIKIISRIE